MGHPRTSAIPKVGCLSGFVCAAMLLDEKHPLLNPFAALAVLHTLLSTSARTHVSGFVAGAPRRKSSERVPRLQKQRPTPQTATPAQRQMRTSCGKSSLLALGRAHSWLFVPLLHCAVGRPDAATGKRWAAHPSFRPTWQRTLRSLRDAGKGDRTCACMPLTLQSRAAEDQPPVQLSKAQFPLNFAAQTSEYLGSTRPLAVGVLALRAGGYIPALAQEALLHVFLGKR